MGYLPQAMVNYLALLGWGDGSENEFFTLDQLGESYVLAGGWSFPNIWQLQLVLIYGRIYMSCCALLNNHIYLLKVLRFYWLDMSGELTFSYAVYSSEIYN